MKIEDFYYQSIGGENYLDCDSAVSYLLKESVLFVYFEDTIKLSVSINDVFIPAADSLKISKEIELLNLLKLYLKHKNYGVIIWAARRLKEQPRKKTKEKMIRDGVWSEELEAFTVNAN